jgi:DNA-binding SARP family transcriptional activator
MLHFRALTVWLRRRGRCPNVEVTGPGRRRQVGVLGRLGVDPPQRLSGVGRRVLAYLAVKGPGVHRSLACMDLWPDLREPRARANLRRALWQLPPDWVSSTGWDLRLNADIDLQAAKQVADLALSKGLLDAQQLSLLTADLLPGWYDEWLTAEQEEFHLCRIQALEDASRTATDSGAFDLATRAALAAVCAEPLRESAVTVLIEAHLKEGNCFEAVRRYQTYAELLRRELDVDPGGQLRQLMVPFLNRWPRRSGALS